LLNHYLISEEQERSGSKNRFDPGYQRTGGMGGNVLLAFAPGE